ncbi:hypothetical protein GUJ93_ZPchr0007g3862 [Zizania palustris]|uniref:Uncharacterized protein n=1 Tax=Zizania palustris TaxID=103762 RepID=A0A8J5VS59_ZIZPA|nr:hypothetical protein GUJ93_ZPchr0007g3862 [Zizania palustris]
MATRSDELRLTLLGLALLGLLLLSHTAAPVDAGQPHKNSFSLNGAVSDGRRTNSFSMNNNEADRRSGFGGPGGR